MELSQFFKKPAATLPQHPQFSFAEVQDTIIAANEVFLQMMSLISIIEVEDKLVRITKPIGTFEFISLVNKFKNRFEKLLTILGLEETDKKLFTINIEVDLCSMLIVSHKFIDSDSPLFALGMLTISDNGGICTALEFAQKVDFSFKDLFLCENPLRPIGVDGAFKYNLLATKDGSEVVRPKIVPKNVVKAA